MQLESGGRFLSKLNNGERPIADKYCEGKMKSTLEIELKGPEIAGREASPRQGPRCAPSVQRRAGMDVLRASKGHGKVKLAGFALLTGYSPGLGACEMLRKRRRALLGCPSGTVRRRDVGGMPGHDPS